MCCADFVYATGGFFVEIFLGSYISADWEILTRRPCPPITGVTGFHGQMCAGAKVKIAHACLQMKAKANQS
jgi:hypothetical protein